MCLAHKYGFSWHVSVRLITIRREEGSKMQDERFFKDNRLITIISRSFNTDHQTDRSPVFFRKDLCHEKIPSRCFWHITFRKMECHLATIIHPWVQVNVPNLKEFPQGAPEMLYSRECDGWTNNTKTQCRSIKKINSVVAAGSLFYKRRGWNLRVEVFLVWQSGEESQGK